MMQKYRLTYLCLLILLLLLNHAESLAGVVSGKVLDAAHKPVAGATVILKQASDNTLARGELTGEDGGYTLSGIAAGTYKLVISALGYDAYTSDNITIAGRDMTLPPIELKQHDGQLKEVTVQAQRPLIEVKADKLVVNVENSIVNTGSSVFEVLGRSPGVTVDQSDNISLKGRPGVTIMMNGRINPVTGTDLANILKSMPSSSIEKIEIISNPGARYDAAGSGGIINIITKKDKRTGLNGTLNASYGQGVYSRTTGGFNLNYRDKKLNLNAGYNYADRRSFNELEITRKFYSNELLKTQYTQHNHLYFPTRNNNGNVALDYNITPNITVGASVNGNSSRFSPLGANTSRVDSNNSITYFATTNHSKDAWNNYGTNAYVKYDIDSTGRSLSVDIDYARYWNQTYQLYTNKYYDIANTPFLPDYLLYGDLSGLTQIRSVKVDYIHPLKNGTRIDGGLKASYVTADNKPLFFDRSSGTDIPDPSKSNHFVYSEHINAAYVNMSSDIDMWSLQLGLRGEQTLARGDQKMTNEQFERQYVQLFPSLAVQRHINEQNEIGMTLSRRIDRPTYRQMNPFKYFLDPTNYRMGNPYLNPTLTYSAELSYIYKQQFITTFTASAASNVITETLEADTLFPNISRQMDKNLARMYFYGVSIAYPFQVTKWWNNTVSGNAYYSYYNGTLSNTVLQKGRPAFDINSTNSFTLPKGFSAELTFYYQSAMMWGFYDLIPVYAINIGGQKSLWNKKATLKISITDLLWTNAPGATIQFNDFSETWKAKRDTRVANITFIYRIGKANGPSRRHDSGAEDEKKRVGGAGNQ